jgi:iron complex outermembrane receptor protein
MLLRINTLLGILALLGGLFAGLYAEIPSNDNDENKDDPQYVHVREEVVVTATMAKKELKDCALSVQLVRPEDLAIASASSALNLLNNYPGLFVRKSGDFGRADVDIRGIGQNGRRIAVLVNGRPEKMGLFGCAVTHAFPLDNVERIEVVKGPASVLYGGEALGGVVNIITHTPRKKFETGFSASYGSFNTRQINVKHGGKREGFNYFFTFDHRDSDGHMANSAYNGRSFTGKVDVDLAENMVFSLQGKYFDGKKYEPGTIDSPLVDFWNDYQRGAVDVSLRKRWNKDELLVRAYRNFGHHVFSDGWDSRDFTNGAMLTYTNRGFERNVLTMGADYRFFGGRSESFPIGEWDKAEGSVFFHDELILGDHWILTGGARLQMDSLFGNEWTPHAGIVFQATDDTSIRAVVNKGFRSPQLNELYMFPAANAELEPERVWNYELGIEQAFGRHLTLQAGIFRMKGSNMIQMVANQSPPPRFIFRNTGEFDFYGLEVGLRSDWGNWVSGEISYSYLDSGDYTQGRPGHKFDGSLRFRGKWFHAAVQGQYVSDYFAADFSKQPLPSYFLLNCRMALQLSRTIDLFMDMNNVFDTDYLVFGDFPGMNSGAYRMPGRNINLGVRFSQ